MDKKIKIDIVSDVVCPWCTIGYKRLKKAIYELNLVDKIEIQWQAFELNPDMPKEGKNLNKYFADKYAFSPNEILKNKQNMVQKGSELDFKFDFYEGMKIFNTQDAHILLEYSRKFGKQTQFKMALVEAFFTNRKDISNKEVLIEQLEKVGLDINEGISRLDDIKYRIEIKKEEANWKNKGIYSVPTMIFNESITLNGALPIGSYKQVLSELIGG
jgi:predicted DsbA family dithiol-disulfide isomerase